MARQNAAFIVKSGKKHLRGCSIYVGNKRTTVRLSPVVADAIEKIADHECCGLEPVDRDQEFALRYFIEAGTSAGHRKAGHGKLIRKLNRSKAKR
jgi:hypothetical protein